MTQQTLGGMPDPPPDARAMIRELAAAGYTDTGIAAHLNANGVRTPSGSGDWTASKVLQQRDPDGWARYMRAYRRRQRRGAS